MKWFFLLMSLAFWLPEARGQVRLKDIAEIEGVRANQLTGIGLVVGLNGTGDKDQTRFSTQALANMLAKSGLTVAATDIKVKNIATVLLSAELPAFSKAGGRLDVTVSSIGDATSLQGGTLLLTELRGVDGQVYALAQGPLSIGGFSAGGSGASVVKNHPTVGILTNGAIVEREVPYDFLSSDRIRFVLRHEDFTTVARAVEAVNTWLKQDLAFPLNSRTMEIKVPDGFVGPNLVEFVSQLENLTIIPDMAARVVVNERTGTIIIGKDVKVDRVAIAHGNLTIQIQTDNDAEFSDARIGGPDGILQTNTVTNADEPGAQVFVAPEGISLGVIAETLNALKVSPRDIIAIMQALKEAGALHAELKLI